MVSKPLPSSMPTSASEKGAEADNGLDWFTDDMLFHYQRCRRRVYLDSYADSALKDPPSDYFVKLRQDSADHRQSILTEFGTLSRPLYRQGDWENAAQSTLRLMQEGAETIYRGILIAEGPDGIRYRSQPDILVRKEGESWLGNWYYVPFNIKLGKKAKPEYQLVAAFSAYVLAEVQGVWPETSWLQLKENRRAVDLERYVPKLQAALDDCLDYYQGILNQASPPEVFISRSRCDMCPWLSHCYSEAKAQGHLSLLPGVTMSRYPMLAELGITTVETLAQAIPYQLASTLDVEQSVTEKMIFQAQASWKNRAVPRLHAKKFPLSPQDLPTAEVELYFDIEAAPDKDLIYLHGVLVVDCRTQEKRFHALLAESPDREETAWFEFLTLMEKYPNAPVYHFCPYEAQTVRRLAARYGNGDVDINGLLARFVDIHKRVVDAVALPVESYALKHLARWMGFEWRNEDANGAQSICWYDDWLSSGDRTYLDTILRYNEDDCWATYRVKDWLVKFSTPFWN